MASRLPTACSVVLMGCSLFPAPQVDCRVSAPECQAALRVVEASLSAADRAEVSQASVEHSNVRICDEGAPTYDVALVFRGQARPLVVTIAIDSDGRLVACTY